jgi:hypothetical protein
VNEIAKAHWDLAMKWIDVADQADDVNTTICYTGMAEFALKAARFAVEYPELVNGMDVVPMPEGEVMNTPPRGPTQGPRLWGAP